MFRRLSFHALLILIVLPLMAFRLPSSREVSERLLYDVRGAFVTAKPDVSKTLVAAVDTLVDAAIQSTVRSTVLPRTIIAIRIDEINSVPMLIGVRHLAKVTVQAVSVASGEPVAEGSFTASIYLFDDKPADRELALQVVNRISSEFRLDDSRRGSLASALAE
jgi:hypothetical protein